MKKTKRSLEPKFSPELLDSLIKDCKTQEDLFGKDGLIKSLQKAILERILDGELTTELGYGKYESSGKNSGNSRNGYSSKTLRGESGELAVKIPRDRNGEFEPKVISKHQRRFDGFDKKIIALYSRGMTTRDIQKELQDLYSVEVSSELISNVTNEVIEEVKIWQSRPLDKLYAIMYLDVVRIKVREGNQVLNKAFYLAVGVNQEGKKELLGIWISENEGSKFWLQVLTELKNRGVEDILIACVDGLTGFPEAIEAVFPDSQVLFI